MKLRLSPVLHDLFAGLALSAMIVPGGMAYAEASGLPARHGLYASLVPLLVYFAVGPSRILVLAPDSALSPLILAAVVPIAGADLAARAVLASGLAVLVGGLCLIAAVARLGFLTALLSLPVRYGYLNGIAVVIIAGQLPKLAGARGWDLAMQPAAFAVGAGVLVVLLTMRHWAPRIPGVLVGVLLALGAAHAFDLAARGVPMVGSLPPGLPAPLWPEFSAQHFGALLAAAIGIAVVSFTDTSVLAQAYASKRGEVSRPNRELLALGLANVAAGLWQGFSVSGSASRTPVLEAAGARTRCASLVAACATGALLVAAPQALALLPTSALAAIVIAAALRLLEVRRVVALWRQRRGELGLSMLTFAAVIGLGVIRGMGIAIGASLLAFVLAVWRPYHTVLVRVEGLKGYHDGRRHPEGRRVPGLVLFRFDAPLFFANAELFREWVQGAVRADPGTRWVVVTAEPITNVDVTAAAMLGELLRELRRSGVVLAFAELKGHVREQLECFGLVDAIGRGRFFRTVGEGVHHYLAETGTEWKDWQDCRTDPSPAT